MTVVGVGNERNGASKDGWLVGCGEEEHYYIKVCSDFNPNDKRPYGWSNLCP